MINKPVLLIDGHNAIHRAKHVFKDLVNSGGYRIGAVWGQLGILKRAIKLYPGHIAILFFDGGRSKRRLEILPSYKGHRKPEVDTEPGFVPIYEQVDMAMELATAMGVHNIKVSGVEGDDLIAFISRHSQESVVYSNDRDFYHLVRPGCSQHVPTSKGQEDLIVTHNNFTAITGFHSTFEHLLFKCISGDPSDGIKGVTGVGESIMSGAPFIIADFRRVCGVLEVGEGKEEESVAIFKQYCATSSLKKAKKIYNQWHELELSLKMVSLWRSDIINPDERGQLKSQLFKFVPVADMDKVKELLVNWEFHEELQWLDYMDTMLSRRRRVLR